MYPPYTCSYRQLAAELVGLIASTNFAFTPLNNLSFINFLIIG